MSTRHSNVPASYLIFLRDNHALLLRRYNTGYEDGNYSLVAGHVDPGETFTECIVREAAEESGVIVRPEHLRVAHIMHRHSGQSTNNERIDTFFIADHWTGDIVNKEPEKCDDLSWFPLDDLPSNTIPYICHALECVRDDVFYSEFGWENK